MLFDRLAVFAGGFDLDRAERSAPTTGRRLVDAGDLLAALVDKSMVVADPRSPTRYRLLETLRQFGEERLAEDGEPEAEPEAEPDTVHDRHARYLVGPDRAGRVLGLLGARRGGTGWSGSPARTTTCGWPSGGRSTTAGHGSCTPAAWSTCPTSRYWRVGYELTDWSEATLATARGRRSTRWRRRCTAAPPGAPGAWATTRARSRLARACGAARVGDGGTSRCGQTPATSWRSSPGTRGRIEDAIAHYERQVELARPAADPPRLNWALFHLAMCRAAVRDPLAGRLEAEEALAVAREADGNPTALCLGLLGAGRALQRTDPAAALVLLDDSAEAAASVRNRWFYAFARMYAAATRGVHSDPAVAARAFLEVLEAWERLGDWSQQWLSSLYATRLLLRIGAAAVRGHAALRARRRGEAGTARRGPARSPGRGARRGHAFDAAARRGSDMDGPAVVAFVRSILRGSGSGSGAGLPSSGVVTGPAGLASVRRPHSRGSSPAGGRAVGRPARPPRRRGGTGRPGTPPAPAPARRRSR